ncbi:MAG: efflux RND transporter periplasmic adaptor subunit [Saprospiraceae bacterium]|nr:efflux RND transporter periplasmic adaptor subunit [Saprospiraceae bacterium]
MKTRSIIQITLTIAVAMVLFFMACSKQEKPEEVLPPSTLEEIPVKVTTVEQSTSSEAVTATGSVESDSEARLSFKTGGVIDRILVDEGSSVKKGQLLAKLNLTEIQAQVTQAQEGVKKAERDLQRAQNLYRDSVATLEQVQNATTALNVAKENLQIAQFNLSYSEIRAPIAGKILKKLMNEGELTSPGNPVFMMHAASPGDWIVKAGLTDKDFVRLKIGDRATLSFDAYPNQNFTARVSELPQSADPMSGLYPVEFKFDTQGKKFTYGMFATLKIDGLKNGSYLSVPVDAIIEGNGANAFVFVPNGDKVQKVPVRVAFIRNEKVMISSGIQPGTQVIIDGSAYLTEESLIKVMN